ATKTWNRSLSKGMKPPLYYLKVDYIWIMETFGLLLILKVRCIVLSTQLITITNVTATCIVGTAGVTRCVSKICFADSLKHNKILVACLYIFLNFKKHRKMKFSEDREKKIENLIMGILYNKISIDDFD